MENHHFWMAKLTISIAMFNSYEWPEGISTRCSAPSYHGFIHGHIGSPAWQCIFSTSPPDLRLIGRWSAVLSEAPLRFRFDRPMGISRCLGYLLLEAIYQANICLAFQIQVAGALHILYVYIHIYIYICILYLYMCMYRYVCKHRCIQMYMYIHLHR